MQNWALQFS